uniref:Histone-lysine N-methyltransferase n=1 Tax=Trichobilharzia regenti TaxID=157069 RepID=A0AA85JZG9_TRIRE|nr:unnamed protein product [Trichobilharzia regenti]
MGVDDNEPGDPTKYIVGDKQNECSDSKISTPPCQPSDEIQPSHSYNDVSSACCVFCGISEHLNLGQGELIRFHTKLEYSEPPAWYKDHVSKVKLRQERCTNILVTNRLTHTNRRNQHSRVVIATCSTLPTDSNACKVGPHLSLDGSQRGQNKNSFGYDCKPWLSGMPTPFFDCYGRPFGLVEELNYVGWPAAVTGSECLQLSNLIVKCTPREGEEGGWIYAHHCCASWSNGVHFNEQMVLEGVEDAANIALSQSCSLCLRNGASISCRVSGCNSVFHFLCAAGAGCLQDIETLELLCPVHISESATSNCASVQCILCESLGDLTELLFCTSCGSHYHASCLEPPLQPSPTIRIGWQCAECKTCLICNESKDENKMLVCDICDKGYHTYCLKPPVSSIPKNGFRCERCRVCSDCGGGRVSATSGLEGPVPFNNELNPNIRWHINYTLCDRCFHTHKRPNSCCPVCERAWRCSLPLPENSIGNSNSTFLVWPGKKCVQCSRMVHAECDPSSNQTTVSPLSATSEETNGTCGLNYVCPVCRARGSTTPSEVASTTASFRASPVPGGGNSSNSCGDMIDDAFAQGGRELLDDNARQCVSSGSLCPGANGSTWVNTPSSSTSNSTTPNTEPGKQQIQLTNQDFPGSPRIHSKVTSNNSKQSVTSSTTSRSTLDQSSSSSNSTGRRRGSNQANDSNSTKTNSATRSNSTNAQTPTTTTKTGALKRTNTSATSNSVNRSRRTKTRKMTTYESKTPDEKDDHPSTVVFCRSDDKFMLEQDICIACGSIGLDTPLLACSQCGQCYHSFCADVPKITRTMIERGWRCLDCTVCEGCGGTSNESLLLLCDDCDISFHTYCLDPPLKEVPKGGWKCADCVVCTNCGQRDPGVNGKWHANYSICAPCASLTTCPVCNLAYREEELLIRCALCTRWAHANCDQLRTEDELELATDLGYNCLLCRDLGAEIGAGHAQVLAYRQAANGNLSALENLKFGEITENLFTDKLPSLFPYSAYMAGLTRSQADEDNSLNDTRQFFMDGVVLSESGLNTIKQALLKSQPKRHSNQRRLSDQQNQLNTDNGSCSLGDSTPVELTPCAPHGQFDEDASLHSGVDAENDLSNYPDWKSPSLQSEEDGNSSVQDSTRTSMCISRTSSSGSVSANGKITTNNSKNSRYLKNLGIGGFRAKPSRAQQAKKLQLAASSDPFVGPPASDNKRRRQNKKKSQLEDSYPDYLMKAFYGASLLLVKRKPLRKKRNRLRPGGSDSVVGAKQYKGGFSPSFRPSKQTKSGVNVKKSNAARLGNRTKSEDSGLDTEWIESGSKDGEFDNATEELDEEDDIDDGDEEYDEDDDVDGDLCDFDELKDIEDEMDNEALDLEEDEDLSATLNSATHQLTERVSEIKMAESSADSDIIKTRSDTTLADSLDTNVSRESFALNYTSSSSQAPSTKPQPSVNSTVRDNYQISSTSAGHLSPKSQNLVTPLDPSTELGSNQSSRTPGVLHCSDKELEQHVNLSSTHLPQEQSSDLSVTTSVAGPSVNSIPQAATPAGLNEAADLMFMDDYLFGFGDLASTEETDLNDITPQQVSTDHVVTNQLQNPNHLPVGQPSKNSLKPSASTDESPVHVSFIHSQNNNQHSQPMESFPNSEKVVYQSEVAESVRIKEPTNSEGGTCLKQFVAQQDLINPPFDNHSQQQHHHTSVNKSLYEKAEYNYPSSVYSQVMEDQHPSNVQRNLITETPQSHLLSQEQQVRKTASHIINDPPDASLDQLANSTDVYHPNSAVMGSYNLSSRETPSNHDPVPSRNVPVPHPRHCVNTLTGNLPELSVSDIETQLGPSTGFELSEPTLADDSPKSIIQNTVFNNDLSTTPPPSEMSVQRIPQQRQNIIHSNPDPIRQPYSHRPVVEQCLEYQSSNQPVNIQQHQISRSSLVTVPIPQNQVRPMQQQQQQQHVDSQGGRVQIRGSQPSYFYAHVVPVPGRVLTQSQKQQPAPPPPPSAPPHQQIQRQSNSPIVLQSPIPQPGPQQQQQHQQQQQQHLSVVGGHGKFISQPLQPKSPNTMTPPPPPPYPSQVIRPGMWQQQQQQQQSHSRLISTSNQGAIMLSPTGQCLVPQASNSTQLLMSSPQSNVTMDTQHIIPVCCQQNTPVEYIQRSCVSHPVHGSSGLQRTPPTQQQMIVHGQNTLHNNQPVHVYQTEHITSPNSRQFTNHPNSLSPHATTSGVLRFNSGSEEVILRCSTELQSPCNMPNPNLMRSPTIDGNTHHVLNRSNQQNILPCTVSNNSQVCLSSSNSNTSGSASRRINYHKWEEDERLGGQSTIAPVLHANISHPTLRGQYPEFTVRAKEISKLWRRLSSEERGTWVIQARNNRTTLRSNQTHIPTTMASGGTVNTISPTQPYCQSNTLADQTVSLQSGSDLSYSLESPSTYNHPQNRTPHHMQSEHQGVAHSPQQNLLHHHHPHHHQQHQQQLPSQSSQQQLQSQQQQHVIQTKELHSSLTTESSNGSYIQERNIPSHTPSTSSIVDPTVPYHPSMCNQTLTKAPSNQSLSFSNSDLNTSGGSIPAHQNSQQVPGLATQSPGSSYLASPVNSRPPSRHQTSLPPPPPIWPPSGNVNSANTGSAGVNSPSNLKQPTPPPACSSVSPAPIRSPASIHAPTPTSFHAPHPYPPHGTSSLTSPAQSPVPPQSPSNINQLMRNNNTGTVTPMPSPHLSPVSQSHHTNLPSSHHISSQSSVPSESPGGRQQVHSFAASHPATPGTPNSQQCAPGNTFSAPATPGTGSSPGNVGVLCHSVPTNPGNVFVAGSSSGIHNGRMPLEDASQTVPPSNILSQSSNTEHISSSVAVIVDQGSSLNSYSGSHPQSHAQQSNYSGTDLERQRLKEILAKQVHQRQVQHQHNQQLMQQQQQHQQQQQQHHHQQQQQQLHLIQQEQEHVMPRHPHAQSNVGPQSGSCSGLVYSSFNQSSNVVHQQLNESHGQSYNNYISNPVWQQHPAAVHDPYHSISPQSQTHHHHQQQQQQQPMRHGYFAQQVPAQHPTMYYQQSQNRPAPISPGGSRVLTSVTPGASSMNQPVSGQYVSATNPSVQSDYVGAQSTPIPKASRMPYTDMSEMGNPHQVLGEPAAPNYGMNNQNMMGTSRSNQQVMHPNPMQVYRSNTSQRNDHPTPVNPYRHTDIITSSSLGSIDNSMISDIPRTPSVAGLEEIGFEPPIIVSRLAAKEKRYAPATSMNLLTTSTYQNDQIVDQQRFDNAGNSSATPLGGSSSSDTTNFLYRTNSEEK